MLRRAAGGENPPGSGSGTPALASDPPGGGEGGGGAVVDWRRVCINEAEFRGYYSLCQLYNPAEVGRAE